MRQVNRDELIYTIIQAMRGFTPGLLQMLSISTQRDMAKAIMAGRVADALGKFEIMSDVPLSEYLGERAFSIPVARMMGEDVPSGMTHDPGPTRVARRD